MAIMPVQSSPTQTKNGATPFSAAAASMTSQTVTTPRTDRLDLSSPDPAKKKELMATYSPIRNQQPMARRQTILNATIGSNPAFQVPDIQPTTLTNAKQTKTIEQMAAQVNSAGALSSNVIQGPQAYATVNKVPVPGS